jgi:hypothetical protein
MTEQVSIESIERRMQEVREELHEEVNQLAASARVMSNWRYFVRGHPLGCGAAAGLLGFFLAPRGSPKVHLSEASLEALDKLGGEAPANGKPDRVRQIGHELAKLVAGAALRSLINSGRRHGRCRRTAQPRRLITAGGAIFRGGDS